MSAEGTAAAVIPDDASLDELAQIAADCTACDLHRTGTQTVFGEGAHDAPIMFVGEQPGDVEDREGHPFVGPAGRELDRALEHLGISDVAQYRTNTVKHFKWHERRGKRRIHEKPSQIEIRACLPWLHAEMARTRPLVLVPLGATAARALIDADVRVTRARGQPHIGPRDVLTIPTVHPSSVLRSRDDASRTAARRAFTDDLAAVATVVTAGIDSLLSTATKPELGELAERFGIDGWRSLRKAPLVTAVAERFAGA